jgi:hypothetical protein
MVLDQASRIITADVAIAYITASGFCAGIWYDRILQCSGMNDADALSSTLPICRHANEAVWTSRYFRTTYLWPSLHEQRLQGEASLQTYDTVLTYDSSAPGLSIPKKFILRVATGVAVALTYQKKLITHNPIRFDTKSLYI